MLSDVEKANLKPRKAWVENIEMISSRLSRANELAGKRCGCTTRKILVG